MPDAIPDTMAAVYLTGYGDDNKLQYVTDAPVPPPVLTKS